MAQNYEEPVNNMCTIPEESLYYFKMCVISETNTTETDYVLKTCRDTSNNSTNIILMDIIDETKFYGIFINEQLFPQLNIQNFEISLDQLYEKLDDMFSNCLDAAMFLTLSIGTDIRLEILQHNTEGNNLRIEIPLQRLSETETSTYYQEKVFILTAVNDLLSSYSSCFKEECKGIKLSQECKIKTTMLEARKAETGLLKRLKQVNMLSTAHSELIEMWYKEKEQMLTRMQPLEDKYKQFTAEVTQTGSAVGALRQDMKIHKTDIRVYEADIKHLEETCVPGKTFRERSMILTSALREIMKAQLHLCGIISPSILQNASAKKELRKVLVKYIKMIDYLTDEAKSLGILHRMEHVIKLRDKFMEQWEALKTECKEGQ